MVCHNYGYDEKLGEEYLDKFVDFSIHLKSTSNEQYYQSNAVDKIFTLILGFETETISKNALYNECLAYLKLVDISKRELKNLLNRFSLLKLNNEKYDSLLLATLFFYKK